MSKKSFLFLALLCLCFSTTASFAEDEKAKEKPAAGADTKGARIFFLTYAGGYPHSSVGRKGKELSVSEKVVTEMGLKSDGLFRVDCSKDPKDLTKDKLDQYDIVMFYTSGDRKTFDILDSDLEYFLNTWLKKKGHGFIGTHAAADTLKDYKPYYEMIGGSFLEHPWHSNATVTIDVNDKNHPISKPWGDQFVIKDEIYMFKNWQPENVRVLMSLNMEKTDLKRPIHIPIAWCKEWGEGKAFHMSLGHNESVWENPKYQESLLGGIKWILGKEKGDATPNPELSKQLGEKSKAAYDADGGDEKHMPKPKKK